MHIFNKLFSPATFPKDFLQKCFFIWTCSHAQKNKYIPWELSKCHNCKTSYLIEMLDETHVGQTGASKSLPLHNIRLQTSLLQDLHFCSFQRGYSEHFTITQTRSRC